MHQTSILTPIFAAIYLASPTGSSPIEARYKPNRSPVTYIGTQSKLFTSGTSAGGLVFSSGTVPSLNGTIVGGGIKNQTAQVISNIAAVFEEAGTSWKNALKVTVFLANISDYAAMNEAYAELIPSPKPARTALEMGKLPGNFLVEIEAVAAIPDC